MIRTQVYLTAAEREMLLHLSKELGLHMSVLIREAIDQFLEGKRKQKKTKKNALTAAAGLWSEREDLPDFEVLRKEFDG